MSSLATNEKAALLEFIRRDVMMDPNMFIESIITDEKGSSLSQAPIHEGLQDFITDNLKGVLELPREHGKTTQLIGRAAYEITRNPNIRIKIISSADRIAIARGKALRETLESPLFKALFPHIKQGREWTDQKFTIKREVISPESTVECYGIYSKAVGGRSDLIFFDDPDDEEVVVSSLKRRRNWDRVINVWLNLLTPDGRAFVLCTPWHQADIANQMKTNKWPLYSCPINGFAPIWKDRWNEEALEEKKKDIGSLAYGRGYNLKVLSDEDRPIKGEWFKYWYDLPRFASIGIAVDPAIGEKSSNDYTAIGLFGATRKHEIYLLEVIRRRVDFPSSLALIKELAQRSELMYKMRPFIGVEQVAFQKAIPQMLKKETKYPIMGLKASSSKFIRASKFSVHVENGRVFLKGAVGKNVDSSQQIVYDECIEFPSAEHDDTVDMMAHGVEMMLTMSSRPQPAAGR